jgi:hypothetical protein
MALRNTLLRINSAIRVIEEEISKEIAIEENRIKKKIN